jgi:rSAM/selenodomain-associated transferase 1
MSAAADVLLVIAKAPAPGRSKTRLTPPCTPQQAARLARCALEDTLDAVLATEGVRRRVLVLEGAPGPWLPDGFEVVAQVDGGLDARLAGAFEAADGPAFLVGMDTPQVTPELLRAGLDALATAPAVLGPAHDGGYWGIGLRAADPEVFLGVPMSSEETGAAQAARLRERGVPPASLPALRDVDHIGDARVVAAAAPGSRFALALADMEPLEHAVPADGRRGDGTPSGAATVDGAP